ncbi:hypothetical protein Cni_G08850 [Canna indica]|uniref:Uncharacterized protein n=1 Tax=Canna indica TaxID=4628 RepID=A0AAQ3K4R2_9LILI|nr:hypothetical protein Cni_G08850 [Canna indica]
MTTLLHQAGLSSPPHIADAAPSPRITSSSIITRPHYVNSTSRRSTQLQAQGSRGFGASVTDKKRKASPDEDDGIYRNAGEDEDDAIPQAVFNRMTRRILLSVGVPMASGVGLLYLESYVKKGGIWELPSWLPLLTILLSFGTSALGIAYGTLSTSWDPEREGSILGWEQAQKNWPELWKEEDDNMK